MQAPKSYKEVQRLAGCLVALNRFISRSGDRNLPFFRKMRQAFQEEFTWDDECSKAFEELKAYLGSQKIFTRPEGTEELQLYLVVSEGAVSSVLIREEEKIQKHIYSMDLRRIIPSLIGVVTVQPLKRILSNPAQTGRLTKWAIELSEFGITFTPRNGIKAQALADFVIECTPGNPTNDPKSMPILPERLLWALYVDEASNPKGAAVGILIHGPEESCFEYALRFQF
ncbi:hypothetical protein LIER_03993 [Lithospermum erythrorhizon]|uniref:Reverse transcriptase/retrotransposon-derived protein RNase H-like domain-containing protein n=1 Tax=Lithospermum erythrorhizon TaxID=34254 RepID=A0AAV3NVI5_LITER